MKKIWLLFFIFTFIMITGQAVLALSVDEWRGDIDYLEEQLPQLHKDLFFKVSEEEFLDYLNSLKRDLPGLNDRDVVLRLSELFTMIGDSHTGINFQRYISSCYPVVFKKFGDDFYLVAVYKEYKGLIGSRLVSINGQPIEVVLNKLSKIIAAENRATILYNAGNLLNLPEILRYCGVIEDRVQYEFETPIGTTTFSPEEIDLRNFNFDNIATFEYKPSIAYRNTNQLFWYGYLEDSNILYFQYNQCWSRELEEEVRGRVNENLPSFKEVTTAMLEVLKEGKVEKFVIDLRHNSGGSSLQGTEFATKLKEAGVKADIYVIIGEQTFSSAIINAIHFKYYNNAILVGEPTRGKPNHFGEVKSFKLPNSQLQVWYSSNYFQMVEEDTDSLYPDITVKTTYSDFVRGVDTVLEAIKKL